MENFSGETKQLMHRAWEARCANFPLQIEFDYPKATEVITLTGTTCALDCAHCGGHYLAGMKTVTESNSLAGLVRQRGQAGFTSCLISGGCDRAGKVPFLPQLPLLKRLKQHKRLNFHVGLIEPSEIAKLQDVADVVSFDFVVDDATIQEVYGLGRTGEAYIQTYRALRKSVKVLPHICIGLKGGNLAGERKALEVLQTEGVDGLVFIVFIPTPGTRYADRQPPDLEAVVQLLAEARLLFPAQPIFLGCMRPKGRYRQALDLAAIHCGVNKIVVPTRAAVSLATELGLKIKTGEECCVL
ncbi:MAG: radical SAM protein [Peptococcaceae bacterium]|nr:radical SAM protein [Peptococcaceae bacterium]